MEGRRGAMQRRGKSGTRWTAAGGGGRLQRLLGQRRDDIVLALAEADTRPIAADRFGLEPPDDRRRPPRSSQIVSIVPPPYRLAVENRRD
jgi:hypothetical protein